MPIIATYIPAQFRLTVLGTIGGEGMTVSRNAAGTLLVNGGAVPVTGGPATVANTDIIEAVGDAGDDIIALDEAAGALPAAELFGGAGNDTLTGGSGADTLNGEADNDTLFGRGGFDLLFGGVGDDILTGGDGDDQMFGGDGNDLMVWNPGDDSDLMEGGAGTDTVEVNGGGGGGETFTVTANGTRVRFDRIDPAPFALDIGTSENLVLNAGGGDDTISATGNLAALISLTLDGGAGNDTILGGNGADILLGGDGNDFVDGQQGNDTAFLGIGDDVFQWDPGDGSDIVEGQAGTDELLFNGSAGNEIFALSSNGGRTQLTRDLGNIVMDMNDVERFTLNALGGTDTITVNDLSGTDATAVAINLSGTIGGATGDGAADALTLNASGGANTISLSGATDALLTVTGLPASVTISQFETGAGLDSLTIQALGGNDTISATGLVPHLAALTIDGGAGNDVIRSNGDGTYFGGDGDDRVFAGLTSFVEVIDGGAGIDTLDTTTWGGAYSINLVTGATNFTGEAFTNFENLTTGNGDDTLTGTSAANIIIAGGGADTVSAGDGIDILNGGLGADVLRGMAGSDVYIVDNAGDIVDESIAGSDGNDIVQSSISFNLANTLGSVENLLLLGAANINAAGNGLSNLLIGNSGNNVLNGGTGTDTMRGMGGNDGYVVDNAGDIVDESIAGSSGTDSVHSLITFNLAAATVKGTVENLVLAGAANIHATGNGLNNLLVGNSGINILNGWTGNDTMRGMAGSDVYIVHNVGDIVDESVAGSNGNDIVQSYLSFSLANAATVKGSVENLLLLGAANINGTGNGLNNLLIGNTGTNVLNGGAAADVMRGMASSDVYVVDNAGDIVDESIAGSSGNDIVHSAISFALNNAAIVKGSVENLLLLGSANLNASGNTLSNLLIGNSGNNVLNGSTGNDTMRGMAGSDTYVVDNAGDIVDEGIAGSAGNDTVQSAISFSLANAATVKGSVENLLLLGAANINASGNGLNNLLTGNSGNNLLNGGTGTDLLRGMGGSDSFFFNTALGPTNVDIIDDFSVPADTITLENAIFTALAAGGLAATAFHIGAAAADALDRIIYNNVTGALIYDTNGSAAGGATQFATLDPGLAMTNADFFIV